MLCLEGAASSKVFLVLLSNIPTQLNSLHSCIIKSVATQVASIHTIKFSAQLYHKISCYTSCKHDQHAGENHSDFALPGELGWDDSAENEDKHFDKYIKFHSMANFDKHVL